MALGVNKVSATGRKTRKNLHARFRDGEDVEREDIDTDEDDGTDSLIGKYLSVDLIRVDGGTQSRDGLSETTISEYSEKMLAGDRFPALTVFYDGESYFLADGFHRLAAAQDAQIDLIECDVKQGTQRDAILFSVGANGKHGLPRTHDDKRRAVQTLLNDAEWVRWSNREIARRCEVSPGLVDKMRNAEVEKAQTSLPTEGSERTYTNRYGQEATMQTGNIGKGDAEPVELKVGDYVRQYQSGQTGPIISINGARITVQTANGARIYDRFNLEVIDPPAADPYARASAMAEDAIAKIHWGSGSDGSQFKMRAKNLGFGEEIYDLLQPGAKIITDLTLTAKEANVQLNKLMKARLLEKFPLGSIVKSYGNFGRVTGATDYTIEVALLDTGKKQTFYSPSTTPSSQEEYEQRPKKHWADIHGEDFEKLVAGAGLQMADALELLQPGAKSVRDLTAEFWDVHSAISDIVISKLAESYPEGALVKIPNGHFGEIDGIRSTCVAVKDLATGAWQRIEFPDVNLTTQDELNAALAALPASGFERLEEYTEENIRAVAPALRRLLDYVEGVSVSPILGKDIAQVESFLEEIRRGRG